jgi:rare lipoprotein A
LNNSLATILLAAVIAVGAAGCKPHASADTCAAPRNEDPSRTGPAAARPQPDLSGRTRFGKGSFYAQKFANRIMADGTKMNPHGDNAASRTLPLGTTARVTNVETGQSAVVSIQDRGPYVKGRIVDLSPSTAQTIGITRDIGVAKVEVTPISVPLPDGSTKQGAAMPDAKPCALKTQG